MSIETIRNIDIIGIEGIEGLVVARAGAGGRHRAVCRSPTRWARRSSRSTRSSWPADDQATQGRERRRQPARDVAGAGEGRRDDAARGEGPQQAARCLQRDHEDGSVTVGTSAQSAARAHPEVQRSVEHAALRDRRRRGAAAADRRGDPARRRRAAATSTRSPTCRRRTAARRRRSSRRRRSRSAWRPAAPRWPCRRPRSTTRA